MTDEQKAMVTMKMAEARRGKPLSEEHKLKLSLATSGRPLSPEHLAALRLSAANRPPVTDEQRQCRGSAVKEAMAARTPEQIAEWKDKLSKAATGRAGPFKGKKMSDETKKKLSDARKGKKLSEEHKLKIKQAAANMSDERKAEISKKLSESSWKRRAKSGQ